MAAHQIIAGALNKGEHVYAVGSVDGIQFTACAVGSDVVVLAPNFDRVQVIPGPPECKERLITSVSCCNDSGKIAATYGTTIRIFEPTHNISAKSSHNLNYRWFETQNIQASGVVTSVLWTMEGLRLMVVCDDSIYLYQHRLVNGGAGGSVKSSSVPVMFCIAEEEHSGIGDIVIQDWEEIWSERLAQPVQYIRFSPDGVFFATAGIEDKVVKVWYQDSPAPLENEGFSEDMVMSFITLVHPGIVKGFEWRRTGRYMPRKCIQNCLMTWCDDHTARIWKESPAPELSIIDIAGETETNIFYESKAKKRGLKMFPVKRTRKRIMNKLKTLVPEKESRKKEPNGEKEYGFRAQLTKNPSYSDFDININPALYIRFYLATTINADTDCLLVPLMEQGSRHQKTFSVHWLNNKELVFSQGAEKLLAEALQSEETESPLDPSNHGESEPCGDSIQTETTSLHTEFNGGSSRPVSINFDALGGPVDNGEIHDDNKSMGTPNDEEGKNSQCSESVSSKDILDVKLEMLLRQWNKSVDILFTIHPVDGSLVTWTVEWLDDINRSPLVSFTSRLPNAFPLTDAACLHSNLCTFNPHDPAYVEVLRRNANLSSESG